MAYDKRLTWFTPKYDLQGTGTGDIGVFAPGMRVKVWEIGFVNTNEAVAGTSPVVAADIVTDGTRGAADGGSLTIPASAIGTCYKDTTSTIFPYILEKHEGVILECTTAAGTSGIGCFYVAYEIIEDVDANNTYVTESA